MVSKPDNKSELNLVRSKRNRLRPVELLFGNFLKSVFHTYKKGSVQASILFNFQGPVCFALRSLLIISQRVLFAKNFFEIF